MIFFPCILVFLLLCMDHICLVSFYYGLLLPFCILYIFSCLTSCGVLCSRGKDHLYNRAFFPPADVLCSFYRVRCHFCSTLLGVRTVDTFHINLVSLFSFVFKWFFLLSYVGPVYLSQTPANY